MGSAGLNNRSNGQQYLGVTEPISLGGPSEFDVVKTQELEKCLADVGLYESQEEAVSREEVLGRLDQLADTTHLLHGVVHVNGYGYLLRINGREGGSKFLSRCHITDFWDRLCKMLRVRRLHICSNNLSSEEASCESYLEIPL